MPQARDRSPVTTYVTVVKVDGRDLALCYTEGVAVSIVRQVMNQDIHRMVAGLKEQPVFVGLEEWCIALGRYMLTLPIPVLFPVDKMGGTDG